MKIRKNIVFRVQRGGSNISDAYRVDVTYQTFNLTVNRSRVGGFRFVVRGTK